jgi:hypothetical protein
VTKKVTVQHTVVTIASAGDSDQTVLSPTTILLIAGSAIHLKTWAITFLGLNFSDKIRFFQFVGLDAYFLCFRLHFRHFHSLFLLILSINSLDLRRL